MTKKVRTADQLIKVIDSQGVHPELYTANAEVDLVRKQKHVKIMMMLLKQLGFEDWHKVHVDNLGLWIDKVGKLHPY